MKPIRGEQLTKEHPLTRGLVGCWLFNEGAGNKVFDLSGNGNTGTFGAAYPVWGAGSCGHCLNFNNDKIDIAESNSLDITGQITILTKIKPGTLSDSRCIVTKWDEASYGGQYIFRIKNTGVLNLLCGNGSAWTINKSTTATLTLNKYATVAVTYDGANVGFFIDGKLTDGWMADSSGLTHIAEKITIGYGQPDVGAQFFDGNIDFVMIYNRALSASEIALLYREPFCMFARAWSPELIGGQIVNLAGTSTALSSLGATAKALRKNAGTAAGASNATAALSSIRGLLPEIKMSWLKEALFNGMTANAFKLGTILSMGWFWIRVAGCSVLYRGAGMGEIDFAKVLAVSERDATEVSPPSYLSHSSGSIYFYVIRRLNSCGCRERTLAAAVKVSIESNGELAEPQPNNIFSSKIAHRDSDKMRLVWFYCPLEQKSQPVSFNVYYDNRTGQIDYQNPLAIIVYKGRKFYSFQSSALEAGSYLFAIRAEDAEGIENSSLAQLKIQVNTAGIEAIDILSAEGI